MTSSLNHVVARAVALVLSLVLVSGCQGQLPTAPSEFSQGIVVYEHADFKGESGLITEDISDLRDFHGPCFHTGSSVPGDISYDWNDCISSIRVAPGWRATIYRDTGFRDDSLDITADVANLEHVRHNCPNKGLNDCISSVRVGRQ